MVSGALLGQQLFLIPYAPLREFAECTLLPMCLLLVYTRGHHLGEGVKVGERVMSAVVCDLRVHRESGGLNGASLSIHRLCVCAMTI